MSHKMFFWQKSAAIRLKSFLSGTLLISFFSSGIAFPNPPSGAELLPENGCTDVYVQQSKTICPGDSFFVGGAWQITAGSYVDSLLTFEGCDSVVTTNLSLSSGSCAPLELWGMTSRGGAYNGGVIFRSSAMTGNPQVEHDFGQAYSLGQTPWGSLLQASDGHLYGLTTEGGSSFWGTLFEYDPLLDSHMVRVNFGNFGSGGDAPSGSLIEAGNGKLYGLSPGEPQGLLFEFDPLSKLFSVKKHFDFNTVGASPYGSLLEASNGKMYGMTIAGGANFVGSIFEYDYLSNILIKKLDLGASGNTPEGSFIEVADGGLYATTRWGGSKNMGVLFRYDPLLNSFNVIHNFDGVATGSFPSGDLLEAANGKLYGMTPTGGIHGHGVLFEYDPVLDSLSVKQHFLDSVSGRNPRGSLMQASNGLLYGMTNRGGSLDEGLMFAYDLQLDSLLLQFEFDGSNGSKPYYTRLIQLDPCLPLTLSSSKDSICAGDSVFAAGHWRKLPGIYYDTLTAVNGCDSVHKAVIALDTAASCGLTIDSLLCVSDSSWWESSEITASNKQGYWGGIPGLPVASSFSIAATVGQPYSWGGIAAVSGAKTIVSLENIHYFRKQFLLTDPTGYNLRLQMYMDDGAEIYLNRYWLAREENMSTDNFKGAPHDLLISASGIVYNGYDGNDSFDASLGIADPDSILKAGFNEIVVAIRNPAGGHNIGGFSLRLDLNRKQIPAIPAKATLRSSATELQVFPNPVNGEFKLLIPLELEGPCQLRLYDLKGRLLREWAPAIDASEVHLELGSLPSGVYRLNLSGVNAIYRGAIWKL